MCNCIYNEKKNVCSEVDLAKKLGEVRKAFTNNTWRHFKHHRGLLVNKKTKLMATLMLIFKDSSLINHEALKAWVNQVLIKRSLDVISGINIKRKKSEYLSMLDL